MNLNLNLKLKLKNYFPMIEYIIQFSVKKYKNNFFIFS